MLNFEIDGEDKKMLFQWLVNQGATTILLFVIVSVCTYLGLTYLPQFVGAAVQVPIQLGRIDNSFKDLSQTLVSIDNHEQNNEKQIQFLIELEKENQVMLKRLSGR
jgi:predicted PurR-regulated permease PerM